MSCFATTWVQVDNNEYIDKDSIKTYIDDHGDINYNKRVFWTKYVGNDVFKNTEKLLDKEIAYILSQMIIDYSNNTIATKSSTVYDVDGKSLFSFTNKDFQLHYDSIKPNSVAALWADLVKRPRILKKMYKLQQANY